MIPGKEPYIYLFGRPSIQISGEELPHFESAKVMELLCYLMIFRDRPHSRESLCGLLWSDTPEARTKKYLRQALWQLQAAICPRSKPHLLVKECVRDGNPAEAGPGESGQGTGLLSIEGNWVHVDSAADYWLDVAAFERTYQQTQATAGRMLDPEQAHQLDEASALYRGDLLEGWYQDWCLLERERLQNIFILMLDKLSEYCLFRRQYERGISCGMRLLRFDRAHERTYLKLMKMYYLSGDRTSALRQYQYCVAALRDDLGVQPSRETTACYEEIVADRYSGPAERTVPITSQPARSAPLHELWDRLQQIRAILDEVQLQLQGEIQRSEKDRK